MNPLEIRYAVFKELITHGDIEAASLESPVPGEAVELLVRCTDGRRYRVSFEEVDASTDMA